MFATPAIPRGLELGSHAGSRPHNRGRQNVVGKARHFSKRKTRGHSSTESAWCDKDTPHRETRIANWSWENPGGIAAARNEFSPNSPTRSIHRVFCNWACGLIATARNEHLSLKDLTRFMHGAFTNEAGCDRDGTDGMPPLSGSQVISTPRTRTSDIQI